MGLPFLRRLFISNVEEQLRMILSNVRYNCADSLSGLLSSWAYDGGHSTGHDQITTHTIEIRHLVGIVLRKVYSLQIQYKDFLETPSEAWLQAYDNT